MDEEQEVSAYEEYTHSDNIVGYQHEPENESASEDEFNEVENAGQSESQDTDSTVSSEDDENDQVDNMDWCLCGLCDSTHLVNRKEYLCCHEVTNKIEFR